ncbi:DUF1824 family protein [Cyanobacterium aponinum UTEX 3222]|uniref:DUF1824 family protein n=1 Tax=Cyanobacterium aponinum AL20115 TaxID=3090662 RepID=A0AAF0ZBW4_9CHRO|nr:DUF1824 family protein [Cyanobacterium aponinum]WPF89103.1 DUF1824 family protein [Cyanobacterium aponinum AL20115]WRL37449.1 DUF1824 family protein [Cyanobacterium aponinum UTEX 3221]WRL43810.1 DUF1824 family protein [Cyanobacterium aponinum UTEX 3222]
MMNEKIKQALSLLKSYSCLQLKTIKSEQEKQELESSIKLIVSLSDNQNFGICASNSHEAFNTLKNYLKALGYKENIDTEKVTENKPVYLKFSTERKSYHLSDYSGDYRGVLITIFADFNEEIIGTYGHFPLNLFN